MKQFILEQRFATSASSQHSGQRRDSFTAASAGLSSTNGNATAKLAKQSQSPMANGNDKVLAPPSTPVLVENGTPTLSNSRTAAGPSAGRKVPRSNPQIVTQQPGLGDDDEDMAYLSHTPYAKKSAAAASAMNPSSAISTPTHTAPSGPVPMGTPGSDKGDRKNSTLRKMLQFNRSKNAPTTSTTASTGQREMDGLGVITEAPESHAVSGESTHGSVASKSKRSGTVDSSTTTLSSAGGSSAASAKKNGRRRSVKPIPEISVLRNGIAAREYEIQRTEKMIRKRGAAVAAAYQQQQEDSLGRSRSGSISSASGSVSSTEFPSAPVAGVGSAIQLKEKDKELLRFMQQQLLELDDMKAAYNILVHNSVKDSTDGGGIDADVMVDSKKSSFSRFRFNRNRTVRSEAVSRQLGPEEQGLEDHGLAEALPAVGTSSEDVNIPEAMAVLVKADHKTEHTKYSLPGHWVQPKAYYCYGSRSSPKWVNSHYVNPFTNGQSAISVMYMLFHFVVSLLLCTIRTCYR